MLVLLAPPLLPIVELALKDQSLPRLPALLAERDTSLMLRSLHALPVLQDVLTVLLPLLALLALKDSSRIPLEPVNLALLELEPKSALKFRLLLLAFQDMDSNPSDNADSVIHHTNVLPALLTKLVLPVLLP